MKHNAMILRLSGAALIAGCVSSSLVDVTPPENVVDPAAVANEAGATRLYANAIATWAAALGGGTGGGVGANNLVIVSGMFTDELMRVQNTFNNSAFQPIDARDDALRSGLLRQTMTNELNSARITAHQAREALTLYAPDTPSAWYARLMAVEGLSIVYTSELFCSGVPLSTVSLSGGPELTRGFTTQELLEHAISLFDTATIMAGDSLRFRYLAAVGKGRALLDMGKFSEAAAAVSSVPTDYVFIAEFNSSTNSAANTLGNRPQNVQVRDNEGQNGLVWSTDPRTAIVTTPSISSGMPVPGKYSVFGGVINATTANPNAPVRAADGLEARLIEAEADLANGGTNWLAILNTLRATCIGNAACAPVPGLTTTNLPASLVDPGNAAMRLDLLMRERAMWLFLTGHRQGDLRRMAHLYGRNPTTLWPVGIYVNPGFPPLVAAATQNGIGSYGGDFVLVPGVAKTTPQSEETALNPLYFGCVDKNP